MIRDDKGIILAAIVAGLTVVRAGATDLTANRDISGGAVLTASPDSVTPQADGKTYWWADKNGNGMADDPVAAGLNLGSFNLTRSSDAVGFTLNLHDGTTPGSIAWGGVAGGQISTAKTGDRDGGPITITGATDIACSRIDTSASGTVTTGAGDVNIFQSGNLSVTAIVARCNYNGSGGRISLMGAGGLTGVPAGLMNVSIAIENWFTQTKEVAIAGYDSVRVGGGGIRTYQTGYGSANNQVTLTNIGTGGVHVAGMIQTYAEKEQGCSDVTIVTSGDVKLAGADTHAGSGGNWVYHDSGSVRVFARGDVDVQGSLLTHMFGDGDSRSRNAGNIEIVSSNGWVRLASVVATNKANSTSRYAGDVTVTATGNVTVTGALDLYSPSGGDRRGDVTLTSVGGQVTLAELNLERLNVARLTSGQGWGAISGALSNFSTNHTGGAGTESNPFVATQTQLRLPAGQRLYYTHVSGGMNDGLGGYAYQVRNLDNSGAGGILMVRPPAVTVFRFW